MRPTTRIGATVAILAVTGALLLWVAPAPAELVRDLPRLVGEPQLAVDRAGPDEVLLTVAAGAAWLVLGWLGCTLTLVALGALPGLAGRVARDVARRIVPGTVRRLLAAALGVGLAAGVGTAGAVAITAPAAWAGTGATPPAAEGLSGPFPPHPPTAVPTPWAGPIPPAALDLDWPAATSTRAPSPPPGDRHHAPVLAPTGADTPDPTGSPDTGTPAGTEPEHSGRPAGTPTGGHAGPPGGTALPREHRTTVTVRAGDTLWAIAGRHLGPGATPREIAAAWPRWWAANRHTVGTDPNVIHPGQRLTAPGPDHLTGSTP
jgi:nucleoid-associated protein YgaU